MTVIDITTELKVTDLLPATDRTIGTHRKRRAGAGKIRGFLVADQLNGELTYRQIEKIAAHRKPRDYKFLNIFRAVMFATFASVAATICIYLLALGAMVPGSERAGLLAVGFLTAVVLAIGYTMLEHEDRRRANTVMSFGLNGGLETSNVITRLSVFLAVAPLAFALWVVSPLIGIATALYMALEVHGVIQFLAIEGVVVVMCLVAAIAVCVHSTLEHRFRHNHNWGGLDILDRSYRQRSLLRSLRHFVVRRLRARPMPNGRHRQHN